MFYFENEKGENVTLWYSSVVGFWYVEENYFATHGIADWTNRESQFFSLFKANQFIIDFWWNDLK